MTEQQITNLLYTIYGSGFNHGVNERGEHKTGKFDAFNRLIIGESPTNDGEFYAIKEKVDKLLSFGKASEGLADAIETIEFYAPTDGCYEKQSDYLADREKFDNAIAVIKSLIP